MQPDLDIKLEKKSKKIATSEATSEKKLAVQLLMQAAQPDKSHVLLGILFLSLAAGLEALGPLLGKAFIDRYLLPHQMEWSLVLAL